MASAGGIPPVTDFAAIDTIPVNEDETPRHFEVAVGVNALVPTPVVLSAVENRGELICVVGVHIDMEVPPPPPIITVRGKRQCS